MEEDAVGLKRGTVRVVPYNPAWAELFEQEKQMLERTFGKRILAIEHVGSTAVPGLPAKPIIDIHATIASLTDAHDFIEVLPQHGYLYLPKRSYPVPEYAYRHFFVKGPESNRTHYLKLIKQGNENLENAILFRDYLRAHADVRDEYTALKKHLAEKYAENRDAYTEGKEAFIERIIHEARQDAES